MRVVLVVQLVLLQLVVSEFQWRELEIKSPFRLPERYWNLAIILCSVVNATAYSTNLLVKSLCIL